jgi:hypothetical protein
VLLLITSTFRHLSEVRALVIACTGMMTLSALLSLEQFWRKMQEAQAPTTSTTTPSSAISAQERLAMRKVLLEMRMCRLERCGPLLESGLPSPAMLAGRARSRSKMRGRSVGGMPIPVLETRNCTESLE